MTTTDKMHTPLEWLPIKINNDGLLVDAFGSLILARDHRKDYIIKAVNSREAIIEALEGAIILLENRFRLSGVSDDLIVSWLEPYRAALALADGEK